MTDREKLIEEAAKAILVASHGEDYDEWESSLERELYRKRARAALAVFDKAHTPTDDERQQLDDIMAEADGYWPPARALILERFRRPDPVSDDEQEALAQAIFDRSHAPDDALNLWDGDIGKLADAILAAGFRRSEVPDPSAEEWAVRIAAVREKAISKGYTPEHDAKHGVRHLLRWAIDYSRRGRAEDSSGLVAAAIDLADIAYAELERLRHVADTMRAVAEALRTRYASDSQAAYFMREIDAALEAAPEPQGEPSDARWIADIETMALAQSAGHARMIEIGEGIGGLGIRNRAMFEDMLAWQDATENGHADTVLRLVAALRAAGKVNPSVGEKPL